MSTNHSIRYDTESTGWNGPTDLGNSALQIAVVQNLDGLLEVLFAGTDFGLYHIRQGANGNGWAGQGAIAGSGARQVAVVRLANFTDLNAFYMAQNGALYRQQTLTNDFTTWGGEEAFKGDSANQITVAQNADGRLEIFYVGTNGGLYHNWQVASESDAWQGEQRFGLRFGLPGAFYSGDSAKQVAVAKNADGRLEIFYVGTNNDLYHNAQVGPGSYTWTGEQRLSGASANQVAVGQNADGRLQVIYAGTNNNLYTNSQVQPNSSTWVGETHLSAPPARQVAIGRNRSQELEVFYVGTDSALYHLKQTSANGSGWTGTQRIETQDLATQVAVANNADGSLAIFYILFILPTAPPGK